MKISRNLNLFALRMRGLHNIKMFNVNIELIKVLETQVIDLSMMSKIELGDDVIAEINRLRFLIDQLEEQ